MADGLSWRIFGRCAGSCAYLLLGGLMAVDIVLRHATGAALGIIGIASYIGAGLQDLISGALIEQGNTETIVNGVAIVQYDFSNAGVFWISASVVSFVLAAFTWKVKNRE